MQRTCPVRDAVSRLRRRARRGRSAARPRDRAPHLRPRCAGAPRGPRRLRPARGARRPRPRADRRAAPGVPARHGLATSCAPAPTGSRRAVRCSGSAAAASGSTSPRQPSAQRSAIWWPSSSPGSAACVTSTSGRRAHRRTPGRTAHASRSSPTAGASASIARARTRWSRSTSARSPTRCWSAHLGVARAWAAAVRTAPLRVTLACAPGGVVLAATLRTRPSRGRRRRHRGRLGGHASVRGAILAGGAERVVVGDPDLRVPVEHDLVLEVPADAFTQVNPAANLLLVATVLELGAFRAGEHALDLYCGAGNFALPLARRGVDVLGVERSPVAVAAARANAQRLGLASARFACDAVAATPGAAASHAARRRGARPASRRVPRTSPGRSQRGGPHASSTYRAILPPLRATPARSWRRDTASDACSRSTSFPADVSR